jgi:iron complex transport system substrate-binding protein
MSRRIVAALAAALVSLLPPAASAGEASSPAFPVTVKAANGSVRVEQRPARIVSLSATATEMLFAVGAGLQVVAVDDRSNYPPSAPRTKLSGFEPNAEAVAGYRPDLVVTAGDANGIVGELTKIGIPVLLAPAAPDLPTAYAQIELLGKATGHVARAKAVVRSLRDRIAKAVAGVPRGKQLTVYHELSPDYFSATSRTFIGQVYRLFGLRNIADRARGAAGDYPKLSAEFVIASDPDLIVLADGKCCDQTAKTVAARAPTSRIAAVVHRNVFAIDEDIASRWGPRVVRFVELVAARVKAARSS